MTVTTDILAVVTPADWIAGPPQGHWTYDAYAGLPEDGNRYEIISGVLYSMPGPNFRHQDAAGAIYYHLRAYLNKKNLGKVIFAPFDVELAPGEVVQPDVMVILKANLARITESRFIGGPDIVIEVASPSTSGYDRREKQEAYARARVSEYWVADPANQTIEVLSLEKNGYRSLGVYRGKAKLPSLVLPELPIQVEKFFET